MSPQAVVPSCEGRGSRRAAAVCTSVAGRPAEPSPDPPAPGHNRIHPPKCEDMKFGSRVLPEHQDLHHLQELLTLRRPIIPGDPGARSFRELLNLQQHQEIHKLQYIRSSRISEAVGGFRVSRVAGSS